MRNLRFLILAIFFTTPALAEDLSSQYSHLLGGQTAQRLQSRGIELNVDAFAAGMREIVESKSAKYSATEKREIASRWIKLQKELQQAAATTAANAAKEYLEANAKKAGVTTTESGIQYEVIQSGEGEQPAATSTVVVHYHGTLTNGEVFDSSYDRGQPATFILNQVIKGWQEALQLMHAGDKWKVSIPPQLAYGAAGTPPKIGPNAVLVFDIELLEVR